MQSFLHRLLPFVPGLLAIVLSIHFGMTLAYLLPLNPIMVRIAPAVQRYLSPWFIQDWHLFAPNPINETRMLFVSCRLQQANGMTVETPWADVSTPLWDSQADQRFSTAGGLVQLQAHMVQLYFDQNDVLTTLERHPTVNDSSTNHLAEAIRAEEGARRVLANRVLARLAAAYCDHWYGTNQTLATRARLASLRFPRFSQRHLPDSAGELQYYTFDWMPYEWVAPLDGLPA